MFQPNLTLNAARTQDQTIYEFLQAFDNYEVPAGATQVVGLNTDQGMKMFILNAREVTQDEIDMHTGMLRA